MTKTALARGNESGGDPIQVLMPGTTQAQTDIGAAAAVWFAAVQAASVLTAATAASGDRIALPPDTGIFLKVPPLGKVAVHDGSTGGAFSNAVQEGVTVVYVYYDSTAGTCHMTEMV